MDMDQSLERFGLAPDPADLPETRQILEAASEAESEEQGEGDTELMRLCCAQLFIAGHVEDSLLIWRAKSASMDAACSIDVQLLFGAGLAETIDFLKAVASDSAGGALQKIQSCRSHGDFDHFSVKTMGEDLVRYYADWQWLAFKLAK